MFEVTDVLRRECAAMEAQRRRRERFWLDEAARLVGTAAGITETIRGMTDDELRDFSTRVAAVPEIARDITLLTAADRIAAQRASAAIPEEICND